MALSSQRYSLCLEFLDESDHRPDPVTPDESLSVNVNSSSSESAIIS